MEVLVGPTFSIEVSAPPPPTYGRDRSGVPAQDKVAAAAASPCLFLKDEEKSPEDYSESSSSIGDPGKSEDEEEDHDDAVSSKGGFGSLASLEDSLPIKRGLSNHYAGKSKSFANISDASSLKDLGKPENPFNKRRRVLMATKWSRRSSFYSWQNPKSTPLLALIEDGEDGNINPTSTSSLSSNDEEHDKKEAPKPKLQGRKLFKDTFKSQSCFSLTDLEEED